MSRYFAAASVSTNCTLFSPENHDNHFPSYQNVTLITTLLEAMISYLRILFLLLCVPAMARDLSVGLSLGGVSGIFGFSGRYWQDHWGLQVSAMPYVYSTETKTEKVLFSSVQILHRFDTPTNSIHEEGGYVHSSFYQYFGSGIFLSSADREYDDYTYKRSGTGGGVGVETFWRNWRLATGVGLALYLYRSTNDELQGLIFPTMDFTLSYGF